MEVAIASVNLFMDEKNLVKTRRSKMSNS